MASGEGWYLEQDLTSERHGLSLSPGDLQSGSEPFQCHGEGHYPEFLGKWRRWIKT